MTAPYELYDFDKLAKPLRKAFKQYKRGKPIVWKGPTNLHSQITATSFGPDYALSEKGLAYNAERGRDTLDVIIQVAIQLGIHQGILIESENTERYKKLVDQLAHEYSSAVNMAAKSTESIPTTAKPVKAKIVKKS